MRIALTILVVVALLAAVAALVFAWRLRSIAGRVGSFACSLRGGGPWMQGVAAYRHEQLVWYDVISFSRSPRHSWDRRDLMIVHRQNRAPDLEGTVLIDAHCVHRGTEFDLAAASAALDGVVSWLEAVPPGTRGQGVI